MSDSEETKITIDFDDFDVHNPHDRFVKLGLDNKNVALDVLDRLPAALKKHLVLDQYVRVKESFISKELQEHITDVLFCIPTVDNKHAYVYVLLEHRRRARKLEVARDVLR